MTACDMLYFFIYIKKASKVCDAIFRTSNTEMEIKIASCYDYVIVIAVLGTKAVSPMRRPFSSAAVLQSQQIPHPLSKVKNTSRVSPASTG